MPPTPVGPRRFGALPLLPKSREVKLLLFSVSARSTPMELSGKSALLASERWRRPQPVLRIAFASFSTKTCPCETPRVKWRTFDPRESDSRRVAYSNTGRSDSAPSPDSW